MKRITVGLIAIAAALSAGEADAQTVRDSGRDGIAVTPYAGYMLFGDLLQGPLGTSLSNTNGAIFGAQLSLPVAGPIALYANGGLARSDLNVGLPIIGGIDVGSTDAWMFDGGLEIRAPRTGTVRPVIQAGAGVTHYSIANSILSTEATNAMAVFGAGFDVPVTSGIDLRLLARDHIGRFDFREAVFADIRGRTTHNIGLTAGLRMSF